MHGVLPNFFVVGAAKSGTTSIYRYLRQHPDVYMPTVKELHWFSRLEPNPRQGFRPITSEEEYLSLFEGWRGEKAIGEASPSYLWDPKAPERIQRSVPSAKILILLREPVDRAFSHYLADVRYGIQRKPFYEALRKDYAGPTKGWGKCHLYVELGLYCRQVSRYLERFGEGKVLVLFFEEVFADLDSTKRTLERVLDFIGVDPSEVRNIRFEQKHNPHAVPRAATKHLALGAPAARKAAQRVLPPRWKQLLSRNRLLFRRAEKPKMEVPAIEFLRRIYEPELICLEELLGHELPWKSWSEALSEPHEQHEDDRDQQERPKS